MRRRALGPQVAGAASRSAPRRAGWVYLQVAIDDHSRYLYAESTTTKTPRPTRKRSSARWAHFAELGLDAA